MKTIIKTTVIAIFLCIGYNSNAQEKSYKETVTENPTAEEDLKVVADYLDAIVNNKIKVVANLLSDDYVCTGPSNGETSTKTEEIANWKKAHEVRTNQKNDYVYNTFRVLEGDYKGDWVSVWGTYTFTENGKEIILPYQYTAIVENGKIKGAGVYYDNLAVARARGYTLTPPTKKE